MRGKLITEDAMNKDRVEGKLKDVGGRIERQAGEWAGDPETQLKGTAKQAEGKIQNAVGKVKDAAKDIADKASKPPKPTQDTADSETEAEELRRARR
jgi:uncharacterized protein YjbJ (UPF0337 family)